MPLTRYRCALEWTDLEENADGDWVRYEDVKALRLKLQALVTEVLIMLDRDGIVIRNCIGDDNLQDILRPLVQANKALGTETGR